MRKFIRIEDREHSKKVQQKLFELGYEWKYADKTFQYLEAEVLVFDTEDFYITWGGDLWEPQEGDVEVTLVEKVSYKFKEVELVELNGKKYRKRDLEEALKNLRPVENA